MVYFFLVAVLITLFLQKNPFTFIRNISFEWPLLILASFGTQIGLSIFTLQSKEKMEWIFVLTFIGIIIGLFINRAIAGIKWILTGAFLNLLAMLLHGGTMPVSEKALKLTGQANNDFEADARHHLLNESTFWILTDWIPLLRYVLSPGDILAGIGIIILIVKHSEYRKKHGVA